ncbi:Isopentenyldiphosphate isomerase [Paenibacillus sp. 1_12]|uniref:NUDIX hydrolase n=1 Tax=Paenibacillus sp. 1_12 TaxID=1566278 RepID=UPI0008E9454A|nr:NUDIX domain-containing protein [Paenibacillus sp. 1_12]SFL52899.1 Isopentenyldiphosphate isomerase [Paenibacillus sp. 1_12]
MKKRWGMGLIEERFDIYDDSMNWLGTASRHEVHTEGLWHQTFQCWILTDSENLPALLFQRRHPDKDTFPGMLDISCAGHLQAGERIEEGNRELKEELGLDVPFEQLVSCGIYRSDKSLGPHLIDREFCHVYGLQTNQALNSYILQEDEVTGLYRVFVHDVLRLVRGLSSQDTIEAVGVEPDESGKLQYVSRSFTSHEFVPHAADYYDMVFKAFGIDG